MNVNNGGNNQTILGTAVGAGVGYGAYKASNFALNIPRSAVVVASLMTTPQYGDEYVKVANDIIKNKKLPIKTVLLDQSIICGIGNIYDDEILFMSKIHPLRKASDISLEECDTIIKNTRIVLEKAIKLGGTTIKSFTSSEGVHGLFQNELLVHGKGGEECPECKNILLKTKVGGRGTHYCEFCQK